MESKVDQFYDLFDEACMLLVDKVNINYLDATIRVGKDITDHINDVLLEEEDLEKLSNLYEKINQLMITNEEIRLALELIIIKGFKHANYSLALMTPDYINYLIANLLQSITKNKSSVTILDVNMGTSNLLNCICNYLDCECQLIGIEIDEKLVQLSLVCSDLQNNEVKIYYQDCLTPIHESVDIIVGDIDCTEVNNQYLPQAIIDQYLYNLKDDGYFVLMVENDFFSKTTSLEFKNKLKGILIGLIVLPQELFLENQLGKSIIIIKKNAQVNDMMIGTIPSVNDKNYHKKIEKIKIWLESMEEN